MVTKLSKKHGEQFIDDVMDTFGVPINYVDIRPINTVANHGTMLIDFTSESGNSLNLQLATLNTFKLAIRELSELVKDLPLCKYELTFNVWDSCLIELNQTPLSDIIISLKPHEKLSFVLNHGMNNDGNKVGSIYWHTTGKCVRLASDMGSISILAFQKHHIEPRTMK